MNARLSTIGLAIAFASLYCAPSAMTSRSAAQYYGDDGGYHASTAGEGYLNGMGSVIQAQGSYNLQTSEAAINLTQAQKQSIDNNVSATSAYYEKRRIHDAFKEEQKAKRPKWTQDDFVRRAKQAAPARLTSSQLDPVTGEIAWPTVLKDEKYAEQRTTLEELFAHRASQSGAVGDGGYRAIYETVQGLKSTLKDDIANLSPPSYVSGVKFLDSLSSEARHPIG